MNKHKVQETAWICFRLTISYDGTAYAGWQVQENARTVAGTIIDCFNKTFRAPCALLGASRTDTGVHALGQEARLRTPLTIDACALMHALNNSLPPDIVIRAARVDAHFHPHNHVVVKEYWYHLFLARPLPMMARFGWYPVAYLKSFDCSVFEQALSLFVGTHDFSSFSRQDPKRGSVRTVDSIAVVPMTKYGAVRVIIRGKGFLHFQIRRMIGAALLAATQSPVSVEQLAHLLAHPAPRSVSLAKAEPQGLCLRKIIYQERL